MSRKDELIAIAMQKYKTEQNINCLEGSYIAYHGKQVDSNRNSIQFSGTEENGGFHYDEKGDTLCNWGRGLGLIYRRGQWAEVDESLGWPKISEEKLNEYNSVATNTYHYSSQSSCTLIESREVNYQIY